MCVSEKVTLILNICILYNLFIFHMIHLLLALSTGFILFYFAYYFALLSVQFIFFMSL